MAGLLDGFGDFIRTPEGQGLLAATFGGLAGAQRGAPLNSIGRAGIAGLTGYGGALDRQAQQGEAEMVKKYRQAQMDNYQSEIEQRKATQLAAQNKQDVLGKLYDPGTSGAPALNTDSYLPQEMRTGILPISGVEARPAGINKSMIPAAMKAGVTAKDLAELDGLRSLGMSEVKEWKEIEGPNGSKVLQGYDKHGNPVGTGVNGYVAPVSVNQGDRTTFVKPAAGVSLPMNMTFADKNAVETQNLARERFNFDKAGGADAGKPQLVDGQWVYKPDAQNPQGRTVPVQGFQVKPQEAFMKASKQLNDLDGALKDYKDVLGKEGGAVWGTGAMPRGIPIPFTGMNIPLPQGETSAKISSRYTSLMMGLKNLYELGALAGPDMRVLEGNLTDPSTFAGFLSSQGSYDQQIKTVEGMMKRAKFNLGKSYGHKVPEAGGSENTGGASGDFSPASDPLGLRK